MLAGAKARRLAKSGCSEPSRDDDETTARRAVQERQPTPRCGDKEECSHARRTPGDALVDCAGAVTRALQGTRPWHRSDRFATALLIAGALKRTQHSCAASLTKWSSAASEASPLQRRVRQRRTTETCPRVVVTRNASDRLRTARKRWCFQTRLNRVL